jgi:phenylalanyl-tRNA synthetase beta chain
MRIPLSWLDELVALGDAATPEDVHAALVSVGFEEEDLHRFDVSGPIVVGEVLSKEPEEHSNGKTINWCQVRVAPEGESAADGGESVRGIVCGAHNFDVGDKVIVTLPGAVLPGNFEIAARKTYGHVSDGMIASKRELGIGEDHDGIIVLSALGLDAPVGEPAAALLGLDDCAVDINVTPDRGYAFSMRGVAREYAHATHQEFADPVPALTSRAQEANPQGLEVDLVDNAPIRGRQGALGFIARVVRGVDQTRPTPQWMVARLLLAGQRPLGLAADISNYVMLELGNPLHAYDIDKLNGAITVRRAGSGEEVVTLDGQTRALTSSDLVIADESGAIAIAGVMGGESTKTDENTTDVLIEAATFDPISIARTARRQKLVSEASKRFERGVDPLVARAAAQRMVDLLVEYGGGRVDELGTDQVADWAPVAVSLPGRFVTDLVGVQYTVQEVREALERIGCSVRVEYADDGETDADSETIGDSDAAASAAHLQDDDVTLVVTPPSWRSDLVRKVDLAEEVARIHGYDRIPSQLPVAPAGRGLTREQKLRRTAAIHMTSAGFTEVQNYPFVTQDELNTYDQGSESEENRDVLAVKLANPLDGKAPFLRRSLLAGLIACAQRNYSRGITDFALVEFGSVFEPSQHYGTRELPATAELPSAESMTKMNESIPDQPLHAGGVLVGHRVPDQPFQKAVPVDWADAIDAARQLAWSAAATLEVQQGNHPAFHPGRTAELVVNGTVIGHAGEVLPELVAGAHLPGRVAAFELDLDALLRLAPRHAQAVPLSTYPAATQDVTLIVDVQTPAADVAEALRVGAGDLLEHLRVVADYRDKNLGDNQKALTFALRFRSSERTLKAEEASAAKMAGVRETERRFGAKIRD